MLCQLFSILSIVFILSQGKILCENNYQPVQTDDVIAQIVDEQPDSIHQCHQGRLYLKPERIYATEKGLFLYSQHSVIKLPFLYSDELGCHMGSIVNSNGYVFYQCTNKKCQYVFNAKTQGTTCPICGSPGKPV